MQFTNWFCRLFRLNPIIFKRFFSRKKANNRNDVLLTVIFIILISMTTALVFRSSCEIFKYNQNIKQFIDNEWNKLFHLYLGDCFDFGEDDITEIDKEKIPHSVIMYIDSLAENENIYTNKGFRCYPDIITIRSEHAILPKVQCFKFGDDFTYLKDHLVSNFKDSLITEGSYLFLQDNLRQKLGVEEDDVVYIKAAGTGSKYLMPLKVKPIMDKTRIKCFIFEDYLSANASKKIRVYFNSFEGMISALLKKVVYNWQLDKYFPVYIGLGNKVFGYIHNKTKYDANNPGEVRYDLKYPLSTISKTYNVSFLDSLIITLKKNDKNIVYKLKLENDKFVVIDKVDLFNDFLYSKHGFNGKDFQDAVITSEILEKPSHERFFLEIDFDFEKIFQSNYIREHQEFLFELLKNPDDCTIEFRLGNKLDRVDSYKFFYYDQFENEELTKRILNRFDEFNIRWDSGRWKTVIDLNESLREGKRNIIFLLIISIIIFLLFLIIKLYLRLKIEFHTIGTIRCFGYNKKTLNKVYRAGYFLMITAGIILGIPLGFALSLISGFSFALVIQSLGFVLINYLILYYIILQLISYFVVGLILNKLVHVDDIYGLIKYES